MQFPTLNLTGIYGSIGKFHVEKYSSDWDEFYKNVTEMLCGTWEYWMLYRGPGILVGVRLGSSPTPFIPPSPVNDLDVFLSIPVCRRSSLLTGEGGEGVDTRSQNILPRESLVLYKSFNTLWLAPFAIACHSFCYFYSPWAFSSVPTSNLSLHRYCCKCKNSYFTPFTQQIFSCRIRPWDQDFDRGTMTLTMTMTMTFGYAKFCTGGQSTWLPYLL